MGGKGARAPSLTRIPYLEVADSAEKPKLRGHGGLGLQRSLHSHMSEN